jgi:hypothetical protein
MMASNVATREEDMTGRNKTQKDVIDTIALLLPSGLDINATDTQGRTAAHGAALWGLTDVVTFLHSKGAKLDQRDKRGFTALDTALGTAGGFGFDGRSGMVREETAKVIRDLLGPAAAAAATSTKPAGPLPERTQDDDPSR